MCNQWSSKTENCLDVSNAYNDYFNIFINWLKKNIHQSNNPDGSDLELVTQFGYIQKLFYHKYNYKDIIILSSTNDSVYGILFNDNMVFYIHKRYCDPYRSTRHDTTNTTVIGSSAFVKISETDSYTFDSILYAMYNAKEQTLNSLVDQSHNVTSDEYISNNIKKEYSDFLQNTAFHTTCLDLLDKILSQ